MKKIDKDILEWHTKTFPEAKLEKQLVKLEEEYSEWRESLGRDIMEAADVYIVATVLKNRFNSKVGECFITLIENGWRYNEVMKAVKQKMEINKNRVWDCKDGICHHKEG